VTGASGPAAAVITRDMRRGTPGVAQVTAGTT
jgi:hypothetical protein